MSASFSGWQAVDTKMTARIPAAAAPKAVATAALPVEAVVIVPTPRRSPSSITSAVARSLLEAVGLRVSSLIHRRGAPNRCLRAGAGSSGVPPTGTGYRTGPSGTGSSSR
jgi:hypothetical protein